MSGISQISKKYNLLAKFYITLLTRSDFAIFFHNSKVINELRLTYFLSNQIQTVVLKNAVFKRIVVDPLLLGLVEGSTGIVVINDFYNLVSFFEFFFFKEKALSFLAVGLFWVSRNRFLSFSYLYSFLSDNRLFVVDALELRCVELKSRFLINTFHLIQYFILRFFYGFMWFFYSFMCFVRVLTESECKRNANF